MTTILPATIADAELLTRIGGQSLLESHGHSAPSHIMQSYLNEKFTASAIESELSNPKNIFHLIYYNGDAAGYSKIVCNQPLSHIAQKNITKLERLYLLKEFYSLKLGHQLLLYNINFSRQHGDDGMWLYVWKGNERALRFYDKAGFQIIGDGDFRLTDDHANPNWQMLLLYDKK